MTPGRILRGLSRCDNCKRKLVILFMTSIEIKTEIQKVLDQVPESVLEDVLEFLKELRLKSPDQIKLASNLRKILSEDRELLEKLAQ